MLFQPSSKAILLWIASLSLSSLVAVVDAQCNICEAGNYNIFGGPYVIPPEIAANIPAEFLAQLTLNCAEGLVISSLPDNPFCTALGDIVCALDFWQNQCCTAPQVSCPKCFYCDPGQEYTTDPNAEYDALGGTVKCLESFEITVGGREGSGICLATQLALTQSFQDNCCVSTMAPITPSPVAPTPDPDEECELIQIGPLCVCFSGHSTVQVLDGDVVGPKTIAMKDLSIGDSVLTADGTYSKVYSFGHYEPNVQAEYLQILSKTMNKKEPLEISSDHLLYVKTNHDNNNEDLKVVPAGQVKVGDWVMLVSSTPTTSSVVDEVVSVRTVTRKGAYTPLTGTGDIVVNGIVASNYVTRPWISNKISHQVLHYLQHGTGSLYRMYCSFQSGGVCNDETYDEVHGFSPYITFWYSVEQFILSLNSTLLQVVCFGILALPATLMVFLGKVLTTSPYMLIFQSFLVIGTSWYYYTNKKKEVGLKAKTA